MSRHDEWTPGMDSGEVLVHHKTLETFVTETFQAVGMRQPDAAFHARALVESNLRAHDAHGVLRLPHYLRRIAVGAINPRPSIQTIKGSAGLEVIDGDDGPGFLVGRDAMLRAIALAETFNIGAVGVVRSNHFGVAALYA